MCFHGVWFSFVMDGRKKLIKKQGNYMNIIVAKINIICEQCTLNFLSANIHVSIDATPHVVINMDNMAFTSVHFSH